MAVLLGLFDSDNYNWRSMTSPGITGLFNPNCLQSGADNLMKCYPGDNTYSGAPLTAVSLINPDNQFHSITTTVAVNGKSLASSWEREISGPYRTNSCGSSLAVEEFQPCGVVGRVAATGGCNSNNIVRLWIGAWTGESWR